MQEKCEGALMARIRSIKPEFWDSPSTAKASPWARLLFIAMWNWADDYGRGTANLKELEGFAFPNDERFTDMHGNTVHFRELVAEVSECFGVMFYIVDGRPYYAIPSWERHQRNERRAKASKYPSPQVSDAVAEIPCNRTEAPSSSGPGTGEEGNRGRGEQGNTLAQPSGSSVRRFDDFWSAYPRKVGKQKARAKYAAATKRATEEQIIDGAHRLATDPNLPEQQFIPHPTTWLERDGWEDEPLPPRPANRNQQRIDGLNQMVRDNQLPEGEDPWRIRKLNAASPSNSSALPPVTTDDPNPTPSRSKHGLQVFDGSQVLSGRTGTRG